MTTWWYFALVCVALILSGCGGDSDDVMTDVTVVERPKELVCADPAETKDLTLEFNTSAEHNFPDEVDKIEISLYEYDGPGADGDPGAVDLEGRRHEEGPEVEHDDYAGKIVIMTKEDLGHRTFRVYLTITCGDCDPAMEPQMCTDFYIHIRSVRAGTRPNADRINIHAREDNYHIAETGTGEDSSIQTDADGQYEFYWLLNFIDTDETDSAGNPMLVESMWPESLTKLVCRCP